MRKPWIQVAVERWPIAGAFAISRGSKREAEVVVATVGDARTTGRGECVPYPRYGETVSGVVAALEAMAEPLARGLTRETLQAAMPAGAARNALDCALWDLEAKTSGRRATTLAGIAAPEPLETAFTIGLGDPDDMATKARMAARHQLLKLKFAGVGDGERLAAVRAARPEARLIVDANEGWQASETELLLAACAAARVELVEQPLPAGADHILAAIERPVPVCADEFVHAREGLATLKDRYDAINIKLDKTGGLTEALALRTAARAQGFRIMVGCMVATSLAMAPALLVAQGADFVDLDGPLLLARDREPGLRYEDGRVWPPDTALWG